MFSRKKKPLIDDFSSNLLRLATQLGVERRLNARVRYPRLPVCKLPEAAHRGMLLELHDISAGGCCLFDPEEVLGPQIGQEIELELRWTTGNEKVRARIVGRVNDRRHIQFLDLTPTRQSQLRRYMTAGVRGGAIRRHGNALGHDIPPLMAAEIWSSFHGDSLIVENDEHRLAQIQLFDESFLIFKDAWPARGPERTPCTKIELEQLVLFVVNIPQPSGGVSRLRETLEALLPLHPSAGVGT